MACWYCDTSVWITIALPLFFWMVSRTSCALACACAYTTTTVAPSCANWMAIPRPMPLSDPVTMATFESNCPIILLSFPLLLRQKTIRVFFLLRRLRDWKCVLSTPPSRLPSVRQDVRRRRVRKGVSGDTPDAGRRLRPCTPTFTVNWQLPLRLIVCARLLLIRDCLFQA